MRSTMAKRGVTQHQPERGGPTQPGRVGSTPTSPTKYYEDAEAHEHNRKSTSPRISIRGLEPNGQRLDGIRAPSNNKTIFPLIAFLALTGFLYWIVVTGTYHDSKEQQTRSYRMRRKSVVNKLPMPIGRPAHHEATWAYRESYGMLNDIFDVSWQMMREHIRTFDQFWPEAQGGPAQRLENAGEWYIFNLQPVLNCPHVTRVGGHGDGPKWICNPHLLKHQKDCLIYSVGSAGVFTWEDTLVQMLDKNCEIHVFDPEPKYERPGDVTRNNIHFHPWGLKSSYANDGTGVFFTFGTTHELKTFPEILKALGHENRRIDIFKIDCEGCEWNTYKDWIGHDIRQISIEIHGIPHANNEWYKGVMDPTELYDAFPANGFAMYVKEVNSYPCGKAVEFSFLKLHPDVWNGAPIFDAPNFGNRVFGPHPELKNQALPYSPFDPHRAFNDMRDSWLDRQQQSEDEREGDFQ